MADEHEPNVFGDDPIMVTLAVRVPPEILEKLGRDEVESLVESWANELADASGDYSPEELEDAWMELVYFTKGEQDEG